MVTWMWRADSTRDLGKPRESLVLAEPSSPSFLAQNQLLPPVAHFPWHHGASPPSDDGSSSSFSPPPSLIAA